MKAPHSHPRVVVLAGPTGCGKNTIIDRLLTRFPEARRMVTATTRAPRPGEHDGVDYYFLSKEAFLDAKGKGHIPEERYVPGTDTHYGTYLPGLDDLVASGALVLSHVDIIGAQYLKERYGALLLFVVPASLSELEGRIRGRDPSLSDGEVATRLAIAKTEIEEHLPLYDHVIVNGNGGLDGAVDHVVQILHDHGYLAETGTTA